MNLIFSRFNSLRKWEFWFGVIGVLGVVFAMLSYKLQVAERIEKLAALKKAEDAEREKKEVERRLAELQQLAFNVENYIAGYLQRAATLQAALEDYQKNEKETSPAALESRPKYLREVKNEFLILADYVDKRKPFIKRLETLANGKIDNGRDAVNFDKTEKLIESAILIARNAKNDAEALRDSLKELKSKTER